MAIFHVAVKHPQIAENLTVISVASPSVYFVDKPSRTSISVGRAFQPDSSGSQAGKPDLLRQLTILLRLQRQF